MLFKTQWTQGRQIFASARWNEKLTLSLGSSFVVRHVSFCIMFSLTVAKLICSSFAVISMFWNLNYNIFGQCTTYFERFKHQLQRPISAGNNDMIGLETTAVNKKMQGDKHICIACLLVQIALKNKAPLNTHTMYLYDYTYSTPLKPGLPGPGSVSAQSLLPGKCWESAGAHTKASITAVLEVNTTRTSA